MNRSRILIAEDEPDVREYIEMALAGRNRVLTFVADGLEARARIETDSFDLLLTDLKMPRLNGMDLTRFVREKHPDVPVITMTAFGTIESAVEVMQAGAIDYLTKPFETEKLTMAVERGLRIRKLLAENVQLRREVASRWSFDNIITRSSTMNDAIDLARRVAHGNTTVIVYGESGTGKELITRGIHTEGVRAGGPFVAINCAALPDSLLESELFGHEKGAFTGAHGRKPGKFEMADGGTLFLDEIGEIPPTMQVKILRAIETREIVRVGGSETVTVDVRFIAATNKDLKAEVQAGRFREDLFYRLNVFPIHLPPLRDRPEDILPLTEFFVARYCEQMGKRIPTISSETVQRLLMDPWEGNVRQLQNTIERAVILLQGDTLGPELVDESALGAHPPPNARHHAAYRFLIPEGGFRLDLHEKELIEQALERTRGKKAPAARLLGLSRKTLDYRIQKFDIHAPRRQQEKG